jgi:predicted phage-related endonuclease
MQEKLTKDILEKGELSVDIEDMASLSAEDPAAFAMARRSGLGASDSSIYLGVNLYKTVDQLITEKRSVGLTPEEIEVSNKEAVRKGRDLEPIILDKFAKKFGIEVSKPSPMFRLNKHPQLTINYDGIIHMHTELPPVEAKFVSTYGDKYWDKTKSIDSLAVVRNYTVYARDIVEHIKETARLYGIPPYYFTQVQQQMLGTNAQWGYFAVLFDKGWDFRAFSVSKDPLVQSALIEESDKVWRRIKGEQ